MRIPRAYLNVRRRRASAISFMLSAPVQNRCRSSAGADRRQIHQVTNLPTHQLQGSPLRLVLIGSYFVLCRRDRIVGQAFLVYAVAVRVADLFVGWTVALDGAFVDV